MPKVHGYNGLNKSRLNIRSIYRYDNENLFIKWLQPQLHTRCDSKDFKAGILLLIVSVLSRKQVRVFNYRILFSPKFSRELKPAMSKNFVSFLFS